MTLFFYSLFLKLLYINMKNPAEKSEKDLEAALGSLINLVKSKSISHTF
jgi:hypothetical protein